MTQPHRHLKWVAENSISYHAQITLQLHRVHFPHPKWVPPHRLHRVQILSALQGRTCDLQPTKILIEALFRPVDVSAREKEIAQRVEKGRDRLSMSRTSSRTGSERPPARPRTPPTSTTPTASSPRAPSRVPAPNVRPTLSFANVAANKEIVSENGGGSQISSGTEKIDDNEL